MESVRGLPLLRGPPPRHEEPNQKSCRRCGKDFGFNLPIIGRNSKECNFCGYSYCQSCCDHQALMPRSGEETGYDPVDVCAFCIDYLMMTASSRAQLRALPLSKIRAYLKAFSIQAPGAIEKDELVQAMIDARQPNGCLPPANEQFYRRSSVPDQRSGRPPKRSFLDRAADAAHAARQAFDSNTAGASSSTSSRPQPPPRPASQPPPQNRPQNRAQMPHTQYRQPAPGQGPPRPPQQPQRTAASATPPPPRPPPQQYSQPQSRPAAGTPPPRRSEEPIPALSDLLETTNEDLTRLSAHVLKEILHQNHVNARLLLEKRDLVERVRVLIDAERLERQREEEMRRLEEEEAIERQRAMLEEFRRREEAQQNSTPPAAAAVSQDDAADVPLPPDNSNHGADVRSHEPSPPPLAPTLSSSAPPASSMPLRPPMERSGLCVVCQDAEANMALVDCGHLALCKACSDLIWSTSRECPLCRTRIVTQERMLRIFRT